jgi:hypothetical protein
LFLNFISVLAWAVLLSFSRLSLASQWTVDAKIQQQLGYNDNVRMSKTPQGSLHYTLTPVVNFSHKTANSLIDASASYGIQRYSSIKTLNRTLQNYHINAKYLTDLTVWEIAASMNIAPSLNTASMYSGNFSSNAERTTQSVSPSFSYKLNEIDSLKLHGNYSQTSYSGNDFNNNQSYSVNLDWQRAWSDRFSNHISISYAAFSSDIQQSSTYNLNLGLNFMLSEQWSVKSTVGGRLTNSESVASKNQSEGFLVNATLDYSGEKLSSQLGINRSLLPSSQGQLQEQDSLNFTLDYALSQKLSTSFSANYQRTNTTSLSNRSTSREYLTLQPALNWQIDSDWTISASYQYRTQNSATGQNTGVSSGFSNSVMLTINYNWQGLSLSR